MQLDQRPQNHDSTGLQAEVEYFQGEIGRRAALWRFKVPVFVPVNIDQCQLYDRFKAPVPLRNRPMAPELICYRSTAYFLCLTFH